MFTDEIHEVINNLEKILQYDPINDHNIPMYLNDLKTLKEGSLFDYIYSYKNSCIKRFDNLLEKHYSTTFTEVMMKYESTKDKLERINRNYFILLNEYSSTEISAFARCNNKQKGMYYVAENSQPYLVIKATTDTKGRYSNKWLEKNVVLKYYLESINKKYNESVFNLKPNSIIRDMYNNKESDILIYCFERSNQENKYKFYGTFKVNDLVLEDNYFAILVRYFGDNNCLEEQFEEMKNDYVFYQEVNNISDEKAKQYIETKQKAPKPAKNSHEKQYRRKAIVTKKAIINADYLCEVDKTPTFINKSTNHLYVEGHHLIPISKQNEFEYDIDVTSNVVALCPKCHMLLHHGLIEQKKPILEKLLLERKENLKKFGIDIDLNKLINYYK